MEVVTDLPSCNAHLNKMKTLFNLSVVDWIKADLKREVNVQRN